MLGLGPTGAHSATALLCPLLRVDRFNRGHVPEAAGCGKDKGLASSCSCLFWSLSPKQHFFILAVDIGSSLCFFYIYPGTNLTVSLQISQQRMLSTPTQRSQSQFRGTSSLSLWVVTL